MGSQHMSELVSQIWPNQHMSELIPQNMAQPSVLTTHAESLVRPASAMLLSECIKDTSATTTQGQEDMCAARVCLRLQACAYVFMSVYCVHACVHAAH